MKKIITLFACLLFVLPVVSGCSAGVARVIEAVPGEQFSLDYGQQAVITGANMTLGFTDVIGDSSWEVK